MKLFDAVHYYLSPSLTPEHRELLKHLLINNGAEPAEGVKTATHIITNSDKFEGWQSIGDDMNVVTETWVERSLVLGKLQPPQFYSAKPADLFSGVVACATDLPIQDLEVLSAGIIAMGGQWRTGLTKEVTHLFAITSTTAKYTTALHHQSQTGIRIILPHWYDDVVRLGAARLSTKPYEWPEPELLRNRSVGPPTKKEVEEAKVKKALGVEDDPMKRSVYTTGVKYTNVGEEQVKVPPPPPASHTRNPETKQVWDGRRILLSRSLLLFGSRREAVELGIRRAGGDVVRWDGDEEVDEEGASEAKKVRNGKRRQRTEADAAESCDIYISRWRRGRAYVRAFRQHKTIGTLAWLYHVQATGTITRPLDQLLHYPIPDQPIEGFRHHEITITNYTGEAREYLKKLIMVMGATFTPSMSAKNTVLIAASNDGTKATKALSWSIPVVNHRWLEDCFIEWRALTFALERYIHFPPGSDFAHILADQGPGMGPIIENEVEQMEDDDPSDVEEVLDEEDEQDVDMDMDLGMNVDVGVASKVVNGTWRKRAETEEVDGEPGLGVLPPPMGTAGSLREVEALVDGDVLMGDPAPFDDHHDEDEPPLPPPRSSVSPAKKGSKATPRKAVAPKKPQPDSETEEDEEPEPVTPKRRGRPAAAGGSAKRYEPVAKRTRSQSRGPRTRSQSRPRGEAGTTSTKEKEKVTKANTKVNARSGRGRSVSGARSKSRGRSQSRGRGRSRMRDDSEDDEEERGRSTKSKSKGRGRSYSRGRGRGREDESEEEEEEEQPKRRRTKKKGAVSSRTRSQSRGRGRRKKDDSETEEDEDEDARPTKSAKAKAAPPKSKLKKKKRSSPTPSDSEGDEIEVIQDLRPSASGKRPTKVQDEETEEDEDEDEIVVIKKGPPTGRPKGKGKEKEKERKLPSPPPLGDDSDEDLPDLSTVMTSVPKKEKPTTTTKAKTEPVQASSSKSKADAKEKGKKPAVPSKGKGKGKRVIEIDDDDEEENGSDAASAMDEDEPPAPPPKAKKAPAPSARRKSAATESARPPPSDVPVVDINSQVNTHSRRAAAAKATAQLRDVIMPDVMSFENQMRKSRKSGGGVAGFVVEGDTIKEERSASAKRKKAEAKQDEEEEEQVGESDVDEERDDGKRTKRRKVGAKESGKNEEKAVEQEKRVIRIATTQVVMPDDVAKSLSKLGVTVTTKPSDCTHLLAAGVVRTEKFLCAIANGAHILKKEWATESAKAGKILPESDFLLEDPGNRHGVDVQQSLERARKTQKLLAGKTFYVSGRSIANTIPLLRNVVAAAGGQLREAQKLTQRVIAGGPERYAISSQEDTSVWRQLGESGIPVYSVELIIAGTLKQMFDPEAAKLEWTRDD